MYKLIMLAMIAMACHKDDRAVQNEFPNQVGNHWVYRFSGYPENTDSIVVDIIGRLQKLLEYLFPFLKGILSLDDHLL